MNIKISDNWLREYLKIRVDTQRLADVLSLSSVSVEKIEEKEGDKVYDIEVTTNRVDLMSVTGLAREAAAILPEFDISAEYAPPQLDEIPHPEKDKRVNFSVTNDPDLVNRLLAVVMEVEIKDSPEEIKNRLESSGIRSLNNAIDITNYLMREMGHPTHVFDYDRLGSTHLAITKSHAESSITTLDKRTHTLKGGDIVAVNDSGEIVDLVGVMGLSNSIVTKKTKRIVLFINNNNPEIIRKTSMTQGIRTEAAILNEKNLDPELAEDTLKRGVELYQKYANGKVISEVIDIYPNKAKHNTVKVNIDKIRDVIGVDIPQKDILQILKRLGFKPEIEKNTLTTKVPTWREKDISISEDIIEEIARVYGYHKIPSTLPNIHLQNQEIYDTLYWEKRTKDALKHWGFTEVYTYSMVGEDMLEVSPDNAVTLDNPLTQDHVYMRTTLVPSLLKVEHDNPNRDEIRVFEIANVYHKKRPQDLPDEISTLAAIWKRSDVSFYDIKGIVEGLADELGIDHLHFKKRKEGGVGADIFVGQELVGNIEVLQKNLVNFELNFAKLTSHASLHKKYTPLPKYPPVIEDVTLSFPQHTEYATIVGTIQEASKLITNIDLIDTYQDKMTFRLTYQDPSHNLSSKDVEKERGKIYDSLKKSLQAQIDE